MIVIHMARKPLSKGTVAANVLKQGTGALDIDGCRIGLKGGSTIPSGMDRYNARLAEQGYRPHPYQKGTPDPPVDSGRWPANLILQHLHECKVVGIKKIRSKQTTAGHRTIRWGVQEGGCTYQKGTGAVFSTEDGLEDTLVWKCAQECPVASVDNQGGHSTTGLRTQQSRDAIVQGTTFGTDNHRSKEYPGDSGGASRFFKQIQDS